MTQKVKDLISPVAEASNLAYHTPFCRIAFWPCCMSGSGVFNLAHVCVMFRSYGAMPTADIFQVLSVIA
jgi:hypothetical protein